MIRKRGDKYVLLSKDGKRVLGTHDTRDEAVAQEKAIKSRMGKAAKHRGELIDEIHVDWLAKKKCKVCDGTGQVNLDDVAIETGESTENQSTIAKLEALLDKDEDVEIEILPNGEIRSKGDSTSQERGGRKPLTMRESLGGEYAHPHNRTYALDAMVRFSAVFPGDATGAWDGQVSLTSKEFTELASMHNKVKELEKECPR